MTETEKPDQTCKASRLADRDVLLLCVFMCAGLSLRFYALDVPVLRWDEMIVALTAGHDLSYIVSWTNTFEPHPPIFHFLIKLLLSVGKSEAILRLPSVIFGVATILMTYRIGEKFFTRDTGLIAGLFVTLNPYLILFSRQIRPYSLWIFLFLVSLYFLCSFLQEKRQKDFIALLVSNFLLFSVLNFLTSLIVAAQFTILLYQVLVAKSIARNKIIIFSVVSTGSLLVFSYSLFASLASKNVAGGADLSAMANSFAINYNIIAFSLFDVLLAKIALSLLYLSGAGMMFLRNRNIFYIFLPFFVVPSLIIVAVGFNKYFNSWHIIYLIPLFGLLAASALSPIIRRIPMKRTLLGAASIVLSLLIAHGFGDVLYRDNVFFENRFIREEWTVRSLAKELAGFLREGDNVMVGNYGFRNSLNWYLRQYSLRDSLADTAAHPEDPTVSLTLITRDGPDALKQFDSRLSDLAGSPLRSLSFPPYWIYQWNIARSGPGRLGSLPGEIVYSAEPYDFYSRVYEARNVSIWSERGFLATPSKNGALSVARFLTINDVQTYPQLVGVELKYSNNGIGGLIKASCRFDDEPPVPVFDLQGFPKKNDTPFSTAKAYIPRKRPYKKCLVEVEMLASDSTPNYPGGNLALVGLKELTIKAEPFSTDFFEEEYLDKRIRRQGLGNVEHDANASWIWGLGPESVITFALEENAEVGLDFKINNLIANQSVVVEANGRVLEELKGLPAGKWMQDPASFSLRFPGKKGENAIRFRYKFWNGNGATISETDKTPYAVVFSGLQLRY